MASLQEQIQQASVKHSEIMRILAETDHAPPDLQAQSELVRDLTQQLDDVQGRIKTLDRKRGLELKDHEKYRDSVMRRFAYKATGQKDKFEAKASKEEREYFDVLHAEQREKEVEQNLQHQLSEARTVQAELQDKAERHRVAQAELDNLYNAIFAGPTPDFPGEDEKEQASERTLQAYHDARMRAETQLRAAQALKAAKQSLVGAAMYMGEAQGYSRADMFGGGTISDMMERNALHKATVHLSEARRHVDMARRDDADMPDILGGRNTINIDTGHLMSDVFFDNIFTDMAMHDQIKKNRAEVERARAAVEDCAAAAADKHRRLEGVLREKEGELESARIALQKARTEAFEKVLSSRTSK